MAFMFAYHCDILKLPEKGSMPMQHNQMRDAALGCSQLERCTLAMMPASFHINVYLELVEIYAVPYCITLTSSQTEINAISGSKKFP
eukprot:scaffold366966_cov30-Prasinocladus_malaysianus.AAC.1